MVRPKQREGTEKDVLVVDIGLRLKEINLIELYGKNLNL